MAKKVTMTDIAKACGVSQTLVSFVLSGKEMGVSEATRKAVIRTAKKLGYSLPSKKNELRCIGVIFDRNYSALSLAQLLTGAEEVLSEAGYTLLIAGETGAQLSDKLSAEGYILITSDKEYIKDFAVTEAPFSPITFNDTSDALECGAASAKILLDILRGKRNSVRPEEVDGMRIPGYKDAKKESVWLL